MKYEKLSEEAQGELAVEIANSDWFFGEIYATLSEHIQGRLVEMGNLEIGKHEGQADAVEASDPILNLTFEAYLHPRPVYLPPSPGQ